MTEHATIFIPDISGYTEFLSKTELDHSSHIINELLELLVASNSADFTLSEIEGDALLFYRKGEPIVLDEMTRQCLEMFRKFHTRIRLIERDSICQCGACQTASNLTLKFIVHYGAIKEIKVANFSKASGLDMIIAHRLLKNGIGSNEYILASMDYLNRNTGVISRQDFEWQSAAEEYQAIGRLDYKYALLGGFKAGIPEPPPKAAAAITFGDESLAIDIAAPLMKVYALLTDLNNRPAFIPGVIETRAETPIDRLGSRHLCIFDDMTLEITPQANEIRENEVRYIESSYADGPGIKYVIAFRLSAGGGELTHLAARIGTESGQELAPEVSAMVRQSLQVAVQNFKAFCEAGGS